MSKISEDSLKEDVKAHFFSLGYRCHLEQVPFLSRLIDLCFYGPESGKILSVELKVKNWRDAIRQARVYQLCSDEVYVVMHPSFAHRANTELFQQFGIGLLAFDGCCQTYVAASRSPLVKERLRDKLVKLFEGERSNVESEISGQ